MEISFFHRIGDKLRGHAGKIIENPNLGISDFILIHEDVAKRLESIGNAKRSLVRYYPKDLQNLDFVLTEAEISLRPIEQKLQKIIRNKGDFDPSERIKFGEWMLKEANNTMSYLVQAHAQLEKIDKDHELLKKEEIKLEE